MQEEQVLFSDLGLSDALLEAIDTVGYKHPTPIQAQAIPIVLMGRDVIGVAQTGTGKTASFTLPLLEILKNGKAKSRMPRALILAPTRELAAQILDNLKQYSKNTSITAALLVGGDSMADQTTQLQRGVDVLIATPGRLMDHFKRGGLIMTETKFFIIDEADRMLDMGFIPDIETIATYLPKLRQTLMFTATMQPEIKKLAAKFLSNPKEISVARSSSTNASITQNIFNTTKEKKSKDLLMLLKQLKPASALIFCNRKTDVDKVKTLLLRDGIKAEGMHGDMEQRQRYASLERFKSGESKIIVCSDIAARGIDIDDVSHVINYDVPRHAEDYVHRIGRTGRAGKTGHALTLVVPADDEKNLDAIIKLIEQPIVALPQAVETVMKTRAQPVVQATTNDSTPIKPVEKTEKKAEIAARQTIKNMPSGVVKQTERVKSAPSSTRGRNRHDDDDDVTTMGFGDDMPAFMRNGS